MTHIRYVLYFGIHNIYLFYMISKFKTEIRVSKFPEINRERAVEFQSSNPQYLPPISIYYKTLEAF